MPSRTSCPPTRRMSFAGHLVSSKRSWPHAIARVSSSNTPHSMSFATTAFGCSMYGVRSGPLRYCPACHICARSSIPAALMLRLSLDVLASPLFSFPLFVSFWFGFACIFHRTIIGATDSRRRSEPRRRESAHGPKAVNGMAARPTPSPSPSPRWRGAPRGCWGCSEGREPPPRPPEPQEPREPPPSPETPSTPRP